MAGLWRLLPCCCNQENTGWLVGVFFVTGFEGAAMGTTLGVSEHSRLPLFTVLLLHTIECASWQALTVMVQPSALRSVWTQLSTSHQSWCSYHHYSWYKHSYSSYYHSNVSAVSTYSWCKCSYLPLISLGAAISTTVGVNAAVHLLPVLVQPPALCLV